MTESIAGPHIRGASGTLELDPAFCWHAVYSRDRRFDGRFFAGITSTGIYCRPICPVSFGSPTNVRWFQSASAAEAAGFRPCKRCRPDTSPGTSAWFGTWAVVSHAVKLISEGALNEGSLEQLAERVGIGSRHLRRLFNRHLGSSPLKIARAHRVQIATSLIAETNLSSRQIASSTGFCSVRQFNHSVKAAFGRSPTQLRRLRKTSEAAQCQTGIVVYLPYRAPFDWLHLLRFLSERVTPGVEQIENGVYRRTIEVGGVAGAIEVRNEPDHTRLATRVVLAEYQGLMQVVQRASRLFDLGADAPHIARHLRHDRMLAEMVAERPGLRVPGAWDGFEVAVRAVLGQRLTSVDSPERIGRIVREFGQPLDVQFPRLSHLFPRPEILASADLAGAGVPRAQAETITALARSVVQRKLKLDGYQRADLVAASLSGIPNLNDDALTYIAMRALGEPNALPEADAGLRHGLRAPGMPRPRVGSMNRFDHLRPWRAYAAMHLWAAAQHVKRPSRFSRNRGRNTRRSRSRLPAAAV